jgi:tetratricopeptide (TPR) repeat protein
LMLSSELAETANDVGQAQKGYAQVLHAYPQHPRAPLALLNAAILMLRTNRIPNAIASLQDFLKQASDSPHVPRARTALGVAQLASDKPAEADLQLAAALEAGEGAVTHLAAGMAAVERKRWTEAEKHLSAARDAGDSRVAERAEHALAVLAFRQQKKDEFRRLATALVSAGRPTAELLYALAEAETQDRAWDAALQTTTRLVTTFPAHPAADDALARLGLAAVSEKRWAIGSEALNKGLRIKYPRSEFVDATLLPAMEALIEIGASTAATGPLQSFVTAAPNDPRATEAYLMLARAREATGDAKGAIDAYAGAERSARGKKLATDVMLKHARLLVQDKRWESARPLLTSIIRTDEPAAVAEAAFFMGQDRRAQGDPLGATEYLMTAAYHSPESEFGQKALLAAAEQFAAMKSPHSTAMAITVYDKLLAQPNVPPDLQQAAKAAREALVKR